jgi:AcrR family transcriptional regulator
MADADLEARIDALAERARADRAAFEHPDDLPDEERAMEFLRHGVGPALAVYVEGRTGDWVRFEPDAFARLERAMNAWLECYAGCYGVELDAEFTLRTAAEALVDTHDIGDVARVLTKVPERSTETAEP